MLRCVRWTVYRVFKWAVHKYEVVLVFVLVFGSTTAVASALSAATLLTTQEFRSLHLLHLQCWHQLSLLRLPQTGAKYSQRWRRRQFCPSFAWTAAKRFAWLSTPTRQFCGSVCDNVLLIRRRRGTFIACLRRWRNFQVCISIRPL